MKDIKQELDELTQSSDRVTHYREGIVYQDKKNKTMPIYIVRQIVTGFEDSIWVLVYGISQKDYKESKGEVIRKMYHPVTYGYSFGNTFLGKLASDKYKNKSKTVLKEDNHLFMSMVVDGTSTLSGTRGPGFFERYPYDYHNQSQAGASTGVFIAMDDVIWEPEDHVDVKSVVRNYAHQDISANKGFYNL